MTNASAAFYVVATPIGNLGDITQRALDVLRAVTVIAAEDTRHTQSLLQHFGIRARLLAAHEHNEEKAAEKIIGHLAAGESVAYVSDAGTPGISDPGARLVAAVRVAGHPVIPLPGACAAVAALSVSGLPAETWFFQGFLPTKSGARKTLLEELAGIPGVLVFYEAPHRIVESVRAIADLFGDARTLVLAKELSKVFETILSDSPANVLAWLLADAQRQRGEFVLLLAPPEKQQVPDDSARVLGLLLADGLPVSQSAHLAAAICRVPRKALYEQALAIKAQYEADAKD